jgi:hypothetical protein
MGLAQTMSSIGSISSPIISIYLGNYGIFNPYISFCFIILISLIALYFLKVK